MQPFIPFLFVTYLVASQAYSQTADTARLQVDQAVHNAVGLYQQATVESQHLYNGSEYYVYDDDVEEHQFFESEDWEDGSVVYDDRLYQPVPMLYDIVKDQVIIEHARGYDNVKLQSEKLTAFTLQKHTFVRLLETDSGIRTGFYDLLYDGAIKVLARRIKERKEAIENLRIKITFPAKSVFFIYKDRVYHSVNNKKSVLGLFAEQKKNPEEIPAG